jgi:hypothetical protein
MTDDSSETTDLQDNYYFSSKGDGRVLAVFRIVASPAGIHELIWSDLGWKPYDNLIRRLISGDPDVEQVSVEIVRGVTPYVDTSEYKISR